MSINPDQSMLSNSLRDSLDVTVLQETVRTDATFDVIDRPILRRFADHWQSLRPAGGFPSRRDLDPTGFPWALPHIYILDAVPAPDYWRYRLAGNEITGAFRRNSFRGLSLSDLMSPAARELVHRRWAPVAEGVGVFMSGAIYSNSENFRNGGRLLLPLSETRDRAVTGLVGMSFQDPSQPARHTGLKLDLFRIDLTD